MDDDGIYDIDEVDPWNSTTPSVVAFRNLYGHNETLMNNSFQQFVRDEMPPIIRKFDARTDGEVVCDPLLGWLCWPIAAWTVVTVEVVDPSPYTVTITVLDNNRSRSFNLSGHAIVTTTITIDILSDALLDYHVNVKAVDVSGNGAETTEKVTGIIGAVAEFFGSVLQAIWGAIVAAVEAVADAVSWLVDWIVNAFLSAITDLLDGLASWVQDSLDNLVTQIENVGNGKPLENWQSLFFLVPIAISLWDAVERVRTVFDGMEKVEVTINGILIATGVGGIVKSILTKVTLKAVKDAIQKIILAVAVGALVETASELSDKYQVEEWTRGLFGKASAAVGIVLGFLKVCQKIKSYVKNTGRFRSKYSTAVALAIVGLAVSILGSMADLRGAALALVDGAAAFLEIMALGALFSRQLVKLPGMDRIASWLAKYFADVMTLTESAITLVGAAGTFLTIGVHYDKGYCFETWP